MGRAASFILLHGKRHPQDMGAAEVEAFLSHLAVESQVSASTQNQAKAGVRYFYQQVLRVALSEVQLGWEGYQRMPDIAPRARPCRASIEQMMPSGMVNRRHSRNVIF